MDRMKTPVFVHLNNGDAGALDVKLHFSRVPSVGEFVHVVLSGPELFALHLNLNDDHPGGSDGFEVVAVDHISSEMSSEFDGELWCRYVSLTDMIARRR